jgi:predicted dehydrogenase
MTVEQLLADPSIEIVLNLTVPKAHAEVALAAIEAGKSVYNEKPLAVEVDAAATMLRRAKEKGVLVGCAPDTFLGAGLQTCRKLIDDGWIGEPVAATAFMLGHGPESWHPEPDFFYKRGAGPLFDMGPYYVTALVALLGPIRRVTGSARITRPTRTVTAPARYGATIAVDVPTHYAGVFDFEQGAVATLVTSFDVWHAGVPVIEIYGTDGSMGVPDPNSFGGPVRVRRSGAAAWSEIPLTHPYAGESRGLGLADMAYALRTGRQHRASGELAYHVLEVMHAIERASVEERHMKIGSRCVRPAPVPTDLLPGAMDS